MADIFISYAHEDQAFVRRMVPALAAEGFSVWWDHTIPPGQSWDSFIARGIKEAKAAIVVWSRNSVTSEWVKEEAQLSRGSGKYLPVQIDATDPPIGFSRIQAAQLEGWDGNAKDPQWQLLVGEVRRVMTEAGALPSHAPRRTPRYTPPADEPEKKGAGVAGVLVGIVVVGAIGVGGYMYLNQSGALNAPPSTPSSTLTLQTTENSELTELRRQMAETQTALEEERRLREEAQSQKERTRTVAVPTTSSPTATTSRPPPQTVTTATPSESVYERRDRMEREIKATGIEGQYEIPGSNEYRCGGRSPITSQVVGDRLSITSPGFAGALSYEVTQVNGNVLYATGERRLRVSANTIVIDDFDSQRRTFSRCR